MSITDELREWAARELASWKMARERYDALTAIADRIDAEHERQLGVLYRDMSDAEWVRLPKDADGEYIRIGDAVTCGATVWTVTGLKFLGEGWGICCTVYNEHGGSGTSVYPPSDLHHYHAPTVEDVLREFSEKMNENLGMYTGEAIDADEWRKADERTIAEYANRLTLAEGEDA